MRPDPEAPRRIVLLGPPASGKGTQGPRLAADLGIPHVSSGALLRRLMMDGDPHGVRALVEAGELVPDEVVERVLIPVLEGGFILDGFPRTVKQAATLDELLQDSGASVDAAVEFVLTEATLEERLGVRAATQDRTDDRPDVFRARLEEYLRDIPDLRAHYADRLIPVDAEGTEDEVYGRLRSTLGLD